MNDATAKHQQFVEAVSSVVNREAASGLYGLLNRISLLRYEASQTAGPLILCPSDRLPFPLLVAVETPIHVQDVRGMRKILHVSSPDLAVLCDGRVVFGLGCVPAAPANFLAIRFQWSGAWQLLREGRVLLQAEALNEGQDVAGLKQEDFEAHAQDTFGRLPPSKLEHLWELILSASRQVRGTNVLISSQAAQEAMRLNSQCTRVRAFALTPAVMERITAIDGSVVIDPDGVCHAIGAILDGGVSARGKRARGGRYNSALMYVDSCPFPSLIVVVSQDGMVDLVFKQTPEART